MVGELAGLYVKYEDLIMFIATGLKNRDEIFEFGLNKVGRSTAYDYVRQTFKKGLPMVSIENDLAVINTEKIRDFIIAMSEVLHIDPYKLYGKK